MITRFAQLLEKMRGLSKSGYRPLPAIVEQPNAVSSPMDLHKPPVIKPHDALTIRRRIASIFDPGHPVETRHDLIGRDTELSDMLLAALELRQHVVLHGARGSGKTSLVRVFGDHADQRGVFVIYMACEPDTTFAEIMRPYLRHFPNAALSVRRDDFERAAAALPSDFGPRSLLDLLLEISSRPVILILDEFDRVTETKVKDDIASFMKLASDTHSHFQLMLVGIGKSVSELIQGHPSLRRHMAAISLGRISSESVSSLIDYGEQATGIMFSSGARAAIGRGSCGSPYHVRLFCQHACIAALSEADTSHSVTVSQEAALSGMASALRFWSKTNEQDAKLFARLAEEPSLAIPLEALARHAAIEDGILSDADLINLEHRSALEALGSAMARDESSIDRLLFKDTVAPQFLIVAIMVTENKDFDGKNAPELVNGGYK